MSCYTKQNGDYMATLQLNHDAQCKLAPCNIVVIEASVTLHIVSSWFARFYLLENMKITTEFT